VPVLPWHVSTSPPAILGVRHHGPGSARAIKSALEAIRPDLILLEGPPEAEELLPLAADPAMQPPVALLLYRPDAPCDAVYYPFAIFSPEWQTIQFALKNKIPIRFMDLPQRHRVAIEIQKREELMKAAETAVAEAASTESEKGEADRSGPSELPGRSDSQSDHSPISPLPTPISSDPFRLIAQAAGYEDSERWWEEFIEKRREGPEIFKAVLEMITALRQDASSVPRDEWEPRREAWMRQTLRQAQKDGFQKIAAVCGAWHGPALANLPPAKEDAELLKGMPKTNVSATWVPWTHGRLTFASGYGAGIESPGYYEHLWKTENPDEVATRWLTRVAHVLRGEDLECSTASVIEATRLADTTPTFATGERSVRQRLKKSS
jgi:hypothetical protein